MVVVERRVVEVVVEVEVVVVVVDCVTGGFTSHDSVTDWVVTGTPTELSPLHVKS